MPMRMLAFVVILLAPALATADVASYRDQVKGLDGLLDYFSLDGDFKDSFDGGNGFNDGKEESPPAFVTGANDEGKAVSFSGLGQFLRIARSIQESFTILAWMKTEVPGDGGDAAPFYTGSGFVYADVGGVANDFGTAITGSVFALGVGNPDLTLHSTTPVVTGEWMLVAAVRSLDGGDVRVYVNGVLDATELHANVSPLDASGNIFIGGNPGDRHFYNGSLDELALFTEALADETLQALFAAFDPSSGGNLSKYRDAVRATAGLVDYYQFEDSYDDVFDGGNGFNNPDNLVSNTIPFFVDGVGGDFEAASFDGSDDYFPVNRSIQDSFTILAWVKADFGGVGADDAQFYVGSGLIYADVPGGANDFGTAITGTTFAFGLGNPDATIHSTSPVADGFWHQVAGVREVTPGSGAEFRLYVDGVRQASAPHGNSNPLNAPALITIGGNTVDRRYFSGTLDEIALFGTALDDADISATYSAFSGLSPCLTADHSAGQAPFTVQFDASCSKSTEAEIASYDWDFGDGETGTGQKVPHTFANPGRYRTVLTVTTVRGAQGKADQLIVVEFHSTDVSPWQSTDVGTPIVKGGARKADGSCLEVYAGGLDIGTREDQFHFVYQTLGGDASVTARVDQVVWEPGGKLGVMLREDLTPGARQVSMLLLNQPAGVKYSFARRETAGALTKPAKNSTELATPPNAWLRVERKGGDLIGSWSADGTTWTELSRVTLAMPESVLCGIAATSRDTTGAYLSLQGKLCDLSTSGGQVGPRFRRGDVDATGSLDISDAVGILSYLFQGTGTPACLEAADTDNNGEVDITDAVNNLGYQFLGQAPPEAPGPTSCGEDPKAPFLGCNQPCP